MNARTPPERRRSRGSWRNSPPQPSRRRRRSHLPFRGQWQRVASKLKARPVKDAPNVVGTPVIVGTPVWVVAHVGVLDEVERGADGLAGIVEGRGVSVITGVDGFGLSATDGLRPPPPSSVEPSGIPTASTNDPGPMDEAKGGGAVADVVQVPGAIALVPPPSNGAVPDSPGIGLPMAAGADEPPAHVAPIMGAAPDVVGLTPGVASSVAPRGIPVCPTGAFGMPSGDVMPSAGSGETSMRACA
jgi:hypothetical protein